MTLQNRLQQIGLVLKKYKVLYLLMLPGIVYYIIFKYVPMYGVIIAFQDYSAGRGIRGSEFVGFEHFVDFFYYNPNAWKLIRNTFMISLYELLFQFPAPILLALLFNELKTVMFKRFVQSLSYLPHFLSTVVVAGILVNFLSPTTGIINHLLIQYAGLTEPIMFLGEAKWFRAVFVGSGIWQGIGWGTILYLAAIAGIDPALYEAAKMDGANRFQQAWHITFVGMVPVMVILLILNIGSFMEVGWQKILLIYNPLNYETSDVIATFVYRRGLLEADFSFATAVGLFQSIVGFILVVSANRLARRYSETSLW